MTLMRFVRIDTIRPIFETRRARSCAPSARVIVSSEKHDALSARNTRCWTDSTRLINNLLDAPTDFAREVARVISRRKKSSREIRFFSRENERERILTIEHVRVRSNFRLAGSWNFVDFHSPILSLNVQLHDAASRLSTELRYRAYSF